MRQQLNRSTSRERSLGLAERKLEGGAPLFFGALSEGLGGGQNGLIWTFLIMLLPMLVASLLGVKARRTYLRDVATAAASSRADKS